MYGHPTPRATALALAAAIPFVVVGGTAIWALFVRGSFPVSKRAFICISFLQALLAGLLFGLWLHFLPCVFCMRCDRPSGPNERVRLTLLFAGWASFFVASWTVCLSGRCVFGAVREKADEGEYRKQLDTHPETPSGYTVGGQSQRASECEHFA